MTTTDYTISTIDGIANVAAEDWNTLLDDGTPYDPFTDHHFLSALEASGSATAKTGWMPQHLLLKEGEKLLGAMPLYLKGHSYGEYIFDHAWADAYQRHGQAYYPKALCAVPFTPATGPRLLSQKEDHRALLAQGAREVTERLGVSSLHVNYVSATDKSVLDQSGFLLRRGMQYHFENHGYGDWHGFLAALTSRRRKTLKKERAAIPEAGVDIIWKTGSDITEADLDQFWVFYQDTGARKWGQPYLTRQFFSLLAETMAERMLFIFAQKGKRIVAGALNMIGGDTLYGRYWGCTEYINNLHFEVCYYQAIDFALAHGLSRVEAGAQGEHKVARGYAPTDIWSAHHIVDPNFRAAIERYLKAEAAGIGEDQDYLSGFTPFKKNG